MNNTLRAFLALVRAGLWEEKVLLSRYGEINFLEVHKLAEEQAVVGLVAAGLEYVKDVKVPKEDALVFVGSALQLEQRNIELNRFVIALTGRLQSSNIFSLLVKGQGVAHFYERPLWRAAGDVDLLLDYENYEKAKNELLPLSYDIKIENLKTLHQAFKLFGVDVELHAKMPFAISKRVDKVIETVIDDSLKKGGVNALRINEADVFLPNTDNHIFLVFTHFLHHFYIEGVGLRQICDWCRMLYQEKGNLNITLLKKRLNEAGLMSEWNVFAAIAVEQLGMPEETMPFYKKGYKRRSKQALACMIKNGNFGHNNDNSYRGRYQNTVANTITLFRRIKDYLIFSTIFPLDSPRFFVSYVLNKIKGIEE